MKCHEMTVRRTAVNGRVHRSPARRVGDDLLPALPAVESPPIYRIPASTSINNETTSMKKTRNVFRNALPLFSIREATIRLAALLCALLPPAMIQAAVITSDTLIDVGDTSYDGQDMVVIGCTLTANGSHAFSSMLLTNTGILSLGGGSAMTVSGALMVQSNSTVLCQGRTHPGRSATSGWELG